MTTHVSVLAIAFAACGVACSGGAARSDAGGGGSGGGSGGDDKVTLCHVHDGSGSVTIEVASSAVPAHLAHGDSPGACEGGGGGGGGGGGNQTKVVVCHEGHDLEIPEEALPAHLAHGDALGE